MTEPQTHTLEVPGAILHFDVRAAGASSAPTLVMIGSPMDATGFTSLAGHFRDRTVVTYDPRGIARVSGPRSLPRLGEAKAGKNRLHFDLRAPGPVEDEVARLVALGAGILRRGDDLTALSYPEGNEFCVE